MQDEVGQEQQDFISCMIIPSVRLREHNFLEVTVVQLLCPVANIENKKVVVVMPGFEHREQESCSYYARSRTSRTRKLSLSLVFAKRCYTRQSRKKWSNGRCNLLWFASDAILGVAGSGVDRYSRRTHGTLVYSQSPSEEKPKNGGGYTLHGHHSVSAIATRSGAGMEYGALSSLLQRLDSFRPSRFPVLKNHLWGKCFWNLVDIRPDLAVSLEAQPSERGVRSSLVRKVITFQNVKTKINKMWNEKPNKRFHYLSDSLIFTLINKLRESDQSLANW